MTNSALMHQYFRISAFVLGSVLVHVAVLYSADNDSALSLSVTNFVQPSITAQLSAPRKNIHINTGRETARQSRVTSKQNNSVAQNKSSRSTNSHTRILILSRVRGQMSQHFYYPAMARRQGWQGKVLLDFLLEDNGHINDIRVKLSSGYTLLDRAAIDALSKVVLADVSNQELRIATLAGRLSMPVVFRLIN